MKISCRESIRDAFEECELERGMVLGVKYEVSEPEFRINPRDFAYVVTAVHEGSIEVRDDGHNNLYTFEQADLKDYELICIGHQAERNIGLVEFINWTLRYN